MNQRIILIMGYPASGKTELRKRFMEQMPNAHFLNRDELGNGVSNSALLPFLDRLLKRGFDVIIDNTFLNAESRAPFIKAAQEYGVDIECHWMNTSFADCQVNVLHRMWDRYGITFMTNDEIKAHPEASKDPNMFPLLAMFAMKKRLDGVKKKGLWEVPCGHPDANEGFSVVVKHPFVRRPPKGTAKAIILDYDGTLRADAREYGSKFAYPTDPLHVQALPNRKETLQRYVDEGYLLLGVTTQSGIGKGVVSTEAVRACIQETNKQVGHKIETYFCPHHNFPVSCYCRKPQAGLGIYLVRQHNLNPAECVYVGDSTSDKTFATRCGFQFQWADDFFKE